ncbi:hypothetical protein JCM4914_03880 [Streptomyces platensis subsp. malvinus]
MIGEGGDTVLSTEATEATAATEAVQATESTATTEVTEATAATEATESTALRTPPVRSLSARRQPNVRTGLMTSPEAAARAAASMSPKG